VPVGGVSPGAHANAKQPSTIPAATEAATTIRFQRLLLSSTPQLIVS
jgi:hypothetical protein